MEIKYKLIDIEIWVYGGKNYPKLKKDNFLITQFVGTSYTVSQFKKTVEREIKSYLKKKDYIIYNLMNPLYLDQKATVISADVSNKNINLSDKKKNRASSKTAQSIKKIIDKHEARLDEIFKTGKGSLKMKKINNSYFSEDKKLFTFEKQIVNLTNKNKKEIILLLKKYYSPELLTAIHWLQSEKGITDIYLDKLKFGTEEEKNIILFNILAQIEYMKPGSQIISIIKKDVLYLPDSAVRNKVLSILSSIPPKNKEVKLINFINRVAETKQLNCSYPAKMIKKYLDTKIVPRG